MNTANKLTMLRVLMIPLFLVAVYLRFPFHMLFALIVFLLACITDFVDGYIASITIRSPTSVSLWTRWPTRCWSWPRCCALLRWAV